MKVVNRLYVALAILTLVALPGCPGSGTPSGNTGSPGNGGHPASASLKAISLAFDGSGTVGCPRRPSISRDEQVVVISCGSRDLVEGDTNNSSDIFVYEIATADISRVSVSSSGMEGNNSSCCPDVSADGRYVVFKSEARNLVEGDTNDSNDVFLHDRQTGETSRVSVSSDGTEGDDDSSSPAITGDGRFVTFWSQANNFSDSFVSSDGGSVFLHDRETGVTSLVSKDEDGRAVRADHYSSLSDDGQRVLFFSSAVGLDPGVDDYGIYLYNRTSDEIVLAQATTGFKDASISANGRFIVFSQEGDDIVQGDTNRSVDVFVLDLETDETVRVSVSSEGVQAIADCEEPAISADGRYVVFKSRAVNLIPNDDTGSYTDIFLHDLQTGQTVRVSEDADGAGGRSHNLFPAISGYGRFVAFSSSARNLVPTEVDCCDVLYLYDRGD